jgi:uncharacterized protein (TIGR03437 family)
MSTCLTTAFALALLLASGAGAQTVINQVLDGAAYTSSVAQGSVFVVKGTGLSAVGLVTADAPAYPTTLNGVSIRFIPVAGGPAIDALMVYTYNLGGVNQLAAVLPSSAALGAYDVRALNSGVTSPPVRTTVVARKPGIVTANGSGLGPAQATLAGALILNRFMNVGMIGNFDTRPARPGERVDLWGTGLGPDRASDTGGTSGDQTAEGAIRVLVAGVEVTPLYAGRSQGFPGLDQVVFNLPSDVAPDCYVPVQVRAGGVWSNQVTLAVAAGDACPSALGADALRRLSLGQTVTGGSFQVTSTSVEVPGLPFSVFLEEISGAFASFSAEALLQSGDVSAFGTRGCLVSKLVGDLTDLAFGATPTPLDAGNTLTATRPDGGIVTLSKESPGVHLYGAEIGSGTSSSRTLGPGTYRLSGMGGADIGAFNAQVNVPNFDWTNRNITAVNRSQSLTINWTGGGTGLVTVTGIAGRAISGTGLDAVFDATVFGCLERAPAGSLTVPTSILQQLPSVVFDPLAVSGSDFSIGVLSVLALSDGENGRFTAALTRGGNIDFGTFGYILGHTKLLNYQ